jgi:hypothetical protein
MRELRAVLLVAVALAIAFPATAGADEVWVPPEGGAVSKEIAAEDGRLVYLGSLGPGPLGLIEGFGAEGRALPATRQTKNAAIRDLDLGTDGRGQPVAVYEFSPARGPDRLWRYDFAAGRAQVMLESRKGCWLSGPHMERGVLYFAREGGRSRPGCRPGIYAKRPGEPLRRVTTRAYYDFDVSGRVIAFIRDRVVVRGDLSEGTSSSFGFDHVYLLRIGQRHARLVASAGYRSNLRWEDFGGVRFSRVSLDDGFVHWKRFNHDTGESDLLRAPVREPEAITMLSAEGRVLPYPRASTFPASSYAVDGDQIYYDAVDYNPSTGSYGGSAIARVTPLPPVFE